MKLNLNLPRVAYAGIGVVIAIVLGVLLQDAICLDLEFNEPGWTTPSAEALAEITRAAQVVHVVELILHLGIIALTLDLLFPLARKMAAEREKGLTAQVRLSKALAVFVVFLALHLGAELVVSFFLSDAGIDYQVATYSFANYGQFWMDAWPGFLATALLVGPYAYFIVTFERTLRLRTKGLFAVFPLAGLAVYAVAFNVVLYTVAVTLIAAGSLIIVALYFYAARITTGSTRQRAIFMGLAFVLLLAALMFAINVNMTWAFWNGTRVEYDPAEIFLGAYHGPIYFVAGLALFHYGLKPAEAPSTA